MHQNLRTVHWLGLLMLLGCPAEPGGYTGVDLAGAGDMKQQAMPDLAPAWDMRPVDDTVPVEGACMSSGWCWENPLPQGSPLHALWAVSANDVWAAGRAGAMLHWDGITWKGVDSGSDATLFGLWGRAADDVWAVGTEGTVLRWDGRSWGRIFAGTSASLYVVWGFGKDDVWVGGSKGTLIHWDGRLFWAMDAELKGREDVRGLWGSESNRVWATIDDPVIGKPSPFLLWDGAKWQWGDRMPGTAWAIWGTGANDIWATPYYWNGTRWGTLPGGSGLGPIGSIWASAPKDYWAVGAQSIMRSSSKAWYEAAQKPRLISRSELAPQENLYAIRGSATNDIWASSHRLHHWDGAKWKTWGRGQIRGFSCGWAIDEDDAWVADEQIMMRLQGGRWLEMAAPAGIPNDMWGSGPNDIWLVGQDGLIVHWDGTDWTRFASGTGASLRRIFGTGPNHAVAVGTGGTILHWDGVSWKRRESGTSEVLTSVWGTGPTNIWAVGWMGTILKWDGVKWSQSDKKSMEVITDLWGSDGDNIWAVGAKGLMLQWDGEEWSIVNAGTSESILSIHGRNKNDIWAGIGGLPKHLIHWNGATWEKVRQTTDMPITRFFSSRRGSIWALGAAGTVLRSRDK